MRALITGITGQDGTYLADFLLNMGYDVYGLKRRTSTDTTERLRALNIEDKVNIIYGDMTDYGSLRDAVKTSEPDEVYNLAAQTFVKSSFDTPLSTFDVNAKGAINLLEAVRNEKPGAKFYQASTSEMFGGMQAEAQNEKTPFNPRSPYAVSKAAAHYATINYREAYGLHASCGILFNHESKLRGDEFVTQKICKAVKKIRAGEQDKLYLGNLESKRDWGHAKDYVRAMWVMLQQENPDDYVIATGLAHSVREFADYAFECVGLDYKEYVEFDERYLRPSDVPLLRGDPSKAREVLGWSSHYSFHTLIQEMVLGDRVSVEIPLMGDQSWFLAG